MQKFAAALLRFDCIHGQRQRLLVFTKVHKTRGQIADKIHIQHLVTLGVKLLQRSLQHWNPIDAIVLKEQPLTSQASRYGTIGIQGVRGREITQFVDVLHPTAASPPWPERQEGPRLRDRHNVAG